MLDLLWHSQRPHEVGEIVSQGVHLGNAGYNTVWMVRGKPGKSHEISAIARDHGGSLP